MFFMSIWITINNKKVLFLRFKKKKRDMAEMIGSICQIIGPGVDVSFDLKGDKVFLPKIHEALEIERDNG